MSSTFVVAAFILFCAIIVGRYIRIDTGFVGVQYFNRKIQSNLLTPGLHIFSFLTDVDLIQITPQTDSLTDVLCTTKEAITLTFPYIEVGNQLPSDKVLSVVTQYGKNYDKYLVMDLIRYQMNVICSKMTYQELIVEKFNDIDDYLKNFIEDENNRQDTGLKINFVRISKPILPEAINNIYNSLANEKLKKDLVQKESERIFQEKQMEMMKANEENKIRAENAEKANAIMISNMKAKLLEQEIANEITVKEAEANAQKAKLEAESLAKLFEIKGYAETEIAKHTSQNQKIYYGPNIPNYQYFVDILNGKLEKNPNYNS